jgi:1-hydroxycarotenoid 3,4-desaturase
VLVVGAGVGGLCAAALLAHAGLDVLVLERASHVGGKLRPVPLAPGHPGPPLDGGPTVLTMRWVFDALFERLGQRLDRHVALHRCELLARHAWGPGPGLDLWADLDRSVAAVADLAGPAEARGFEAFSARAQSVYRTLEGPFMRSRRPNPGSLAWRVWQQQGPRGLAQLMRISPFTTLWHELGRFFQDPRLQQLFGRYATYCGTSPFVAPATLMLVAHVEREAVWQLDGGLQSLARALAGVAQAQGARLRMDCPVSRLLMHDGRVTGVALADGEVLHAEHVVFNGDARALSDGGLGPAVQQALGPAPRATPSLSALTWHFEAEVAAGGWVPSHHNVLFGAPEAYRAEFAAIAQGRLPERPTVYLCAQDRRGDADASAPRGPERLMALVNAPAGAPLTPEEIDRCEQQMWTQLSHAGLVCRPTQRAVRTTPADFAQRFPGTGGALYGPASQGWRASFFARPDGRTRVPGLTLAGGSVHPGPGVPMAALSGQMAAEQILAGRVSTSPWVAVPMPGGTPTR